MVKYVEDTTFLSRVDAELANARRCFPEQPRWQAILALMEECGEVSKAFLQNKREALAKECVQVAVMAMRIAIEYPDIPGQLVGGISDYDRGFNEGVSAAVKDAETVGGRHPDPLVDET